MTKPYDEYQNLLAQKQKLDEQLKAIQFALYDKTSADVVEHIHQLQLEKTKQQGIVKNAQQHLAEIEPELALATQDVEKTLLEAIANQRVYYFQNKREIVFDSHVGLLLANFEYMPLIKYDDWNAQQKTYAPSGIAQGKWKCLHDYWCYKDGKYYGYGSDDWYKTSEPSQSLPYKSLSSQNLLIYFSGYYYYYSLDQGCQYFPFRCSYSTNSTRGYCIFPVYHILQDERIFPNNPRFTSLEKAKIILEFFLQQEWIPIFDADLQQQQDEGNDNFLERKQKYDELSEQYFEQFLQRHQLQKQIITLEQQLAEFPPPAQTWLNSEFDYRPVLAQYPLSEIQSSIWQYSLSAQTWLNTLLTQLDEWQTEHHQVMATALELNTQFEHSLPLSPRLNEQEILALNTLHQQLKQRLNFSLEPTKAKLIQLLKQNQEIERTLKQTDDLMALAELEQKKRPSFALLAEHSATLCTENLKNLEWLEQHLAFITQLVQSAQQQHDNYLILVDKYQQDLTATASDNAVDVEHIEKWLNEWRSERLILVQQWLPLVIAGLNHDLTAETVLATLTCLSHYQTNLDQFYLKERLGIYTKFAFQANGHRQEQLEKDSQLVKLNHDFMNELQTVMFNTSTSREKLWLLQYSEVWQQQLAKEIQTFLQQENLIERDDIAQLIMDDMRKIQQQNLASCLQDAQRYSEALEQRNKDTNTFIFKMRKALTKE